jgi:hypothetical protein
VSAPSWSPDGQWIAYEVVASSGDTKQLYKVRRDGAQVTTLTPDGSRATVTRLALTVRPPFPAPRPRYMRGHTPGARLARALRGWLALLALGACAELPTGASRGPHAPPATGAAVRLSATVAGTAVTALSVTVTAADVPVPVVVNLDVAGGTAAGTVRVPPGPARTFTVRAFDARGVLTHEGARTVDVAPADNAPLALALYPRAGGVPLEVTFGSYTLSVAPAETTLAVGDTAVLTALVVTAEGDTLRDRAAWVTLDPTRATVRTTTGAAPGPRPGHRPRGRRRARGGHPRRPRRRGARPRRRRAPGRRRPSRRGHAAGRHRRRRAPRRVAPRHRQHAPGHRPLGGRPDGPACVA